MSALREAAQQALEALEFMADQWGFTNKANRPERWRAIDALRTALAQQDEMQEMLRTLGFDHQCTESIGITLRRWRDGYAAALAQQEQADYPEEKLQAVAEYMSDKYHVWYGVAARDIEEVLRQSVRCGLVSNAPRREWVSLTEEEIEDMSVNGTDSELRRQQFARVIEQALRSKNNG